MEQVEGLYPKLAEKYFPPIERKEANELRTFIYDVETFLYDWVVVFKDRENGEYTVIHNDNESVREFISDENIYIGFNSKSFDTYIIKAICGECTPEEIKQISDFIVTGNQGWMHPLLRGNYFKFNNVDIRNDVQLGLSLKAIEGHLGMSIQESSIPFDIDRTLTEDELKEVVSYCCHDVDATDKLVEIREDYLRTKINLGRRAEIADCESMAMTNAKITAAMLGAVKQERLDGRDYVYPENLDKEVIPNEIITFFNKIYDKSIDEETLFKDYLKIDIGDMPCKYAWGGVHGSLTGYEEHTTDERIIQNRDVSSLYPSLIVEYDYLSRNVPDKALFRQMRDERLNAKHTGNKQMANDLKLPLNTVSGAQENKWNDLYDPLPTRSLRISGQLFLTVLAVRLINACTTIRLLNFNTDGLMYSVDINELAIVDKICHDWEKETRFELETDNLKSVWIKDVNNLLSVGDTGKVKTVGGYLNYGISVKGAWSINNNATIVKKAITDYFVNGTPVEETIGNCEDIFEFQIIAKAGQKYKEAYHEVDGSREPVQKVNRVYATSDERYGKLFKVKAENDATAKIESLPDHCIIDNDNKLSISDVDKSFYIEVANKRINDFRGIKPEKPKRRTKKMATTKTENVYQKLLKARAQFLEADVDKTGKNMHLSFKYFELDDIVPTATRIFSEIGLIALPNFTTDTATIIIVNTDSPEETVTFTAPFNQISPIFSNAGKQATNEMQALGSSITYMRRYLYMIALDICESDGIDNNVGVPEPKSSKPATPEQRENTKKALTDSEGNASELQLKQLKNACKTLKEKDPDNEEFLAKLAIKTEGFTKITKSACEKIMLQIAQMLEEDEE
ncbi:hypothetical protein FACS189499_03600 [Clostridia bacterium]|nr:hypothetical protein FACS189499_03600 [Clostridia bacterium]